MAPTSAARPAVARRDRRLVERAREHLRHSHLARLVILAGATLIVLANTFVDASSIYHVVTGDLDRYRAWVTVSLGLTAVINILVLVLIWILFETMGRVERESDRVQRLADTMYRRLP